MTSYHNIETIRAQVINAGYSFSITDRSEDVQFKARLINISAGYLELLVKPAQIEKRSRENTVKIDPDDTTIRAFYEVGKETFSLLRQSLHSQKKLNAEVFLRLDTTLTLTDQGDLIINDPIKAHILDCEFSRNFT